MASSRWFRYFVLVALAASQPVLSLANRAGSVNILNGPEEVEDEYDYVICGGGTAGLTVADRLTADGKSTVLVLENGYFDDTDTIYQIRGGRAGYTPERMTSIPGVPQSGLGNRIFNVNVGNIVGGSSAVNGMVYSRGTKEDYDRWGALWGEGSDWTWDGLLPYFKKATNFTAPPSRVAEEFDIRYDLNMYAAEPLEGSIKAGWPSYQFPGVKMQIKAFEELGYPIAGDCAHGETGIAWVPNSMNQKNVSRSYAKSDHLDGLARPNYSILPSAKVTKVLFDDDKGARGATFRPRNGGPGDLFTVAARKEVILALGVVHSPQILQVSGVGPKDLLEEAGIQVVVDLPGVGQNFQDHPDGNLPCTFETINISVTGQDLTDNATFIEWAEHLWKTKEGPYSLAAGSAAAWLSLQDVAPDNWESIADEFAAQDPATYLPDDIHPDVLKGYAAQHKLYASALRSNNTTVYQSYLSGTFQPGTGWTLMQQVSRGSISINVTDPSGSEPVIDHRVFSNPTDKKIFLELARFTMKYYLTAPGVKEQGAKYGIDVDDYDALEKWTDQNAKPTEAHPVGTCAMMPRGLGGVVGEDLLVYGVKRLSVVDASVIPMVPGTPILATVYAVAEKGADLIKSRNS